MEHLCGDLCFFSHINEIRHLCPDAKETPVPVHLTGVHWSCAGHTSFSTPSLILYLYRAGFVYKSNVMLEQVWTTYPMKGICNARAYKDIQANCVFQSLCGCSLKKNHVSGHHCYPNKNQDCSAWKYINREGGREQDVLSNQSQINTKSFHWAQHDMAWLATPVFLKRKMILLLL